MKLTYRGLSYESNPITLETSQGEVGGTYRGLDWRFRNLKKPPVLQPRVNLSYRGVKYNQLGTVDTKTVTCETTPTISTESKARALMINKTNRIKKRQQTLLSRIAAEIGLSGNTGDYENRIQGKIHPTFRINYDRFGASFS